MKKSENNTHSNHEGIFSGFKQNLIYLIMFVLLIFSYFNYGWPTEKHDHQYEEKSKFSFKFALLCLIALVIFVFIMLTSARNFEKNAKVTTNANQKNFVQRVSKEEYERQKQEVTQKELEKLYKSEQFRKMKNMKGERMSEWNWQTKENEKKVVFREDPIDDDEDEHLSQVDVSYT